MTDCTLKNPPHLDGDPRPMSPQCCCNCVSHVAVHFHCTTRPQPKGFRMKCSCSTQKVVGRSKKLNFACLMFARSERGERGRIHDHWPEHSYGCECYQPRNADVQAEVERD